MATHWRVAVLVLTIKKFWEAGTNHLREFTAGLTKSKRPDHKPGEILSDALLGLSLADTLVEGGGRLDLTTLKTNFTTVLESEEFLASSPGAQRLALMRGMVDDRHTGEHVERKHASGAARAFTAGCLPGEPLSDEPSKVAVNQAALTHSDTTVQAAAAVVADSVRYLIRGGVLDTEDKVREFVRHEFTLAEVINAQFAEAWDDVAPDLDYVRPAQELPYSLINVVSSVNELVPTAVGIFLIFRHNFEDAVCAAARAGGTTDAVAVIVGALPEPVMVPAPFLNVGWNRFRTERGWKIRPNHSLVYGRKRNKVGRDL